MKKLGPESKKLIAYGAGAGLGIVVPFALNKYVEPAYPSPLIQYMGVWGKWGTIVPIATGAVGLIFAQFTKKIKNQNVKGMLTMYGITALIVGALNGMADSGYLGARGARYAPQRAGYSAPVVVRQAGNGMQYTPTGISQRVIRA